MEKYNPTAIRRCVRRTEVVQGQVHFATKSWTQADADVKHNPVVDLETGMVHCDCGDFRFRHAKHEPNINTPEHHCKHLRRAIANCERYGEIVKVTPEPEPPLAPECAAFFGR